MQYIPLAAPFFLALFLIYVFVVVLIEFRILQYTFEKVGVDRRYMFFLLLFSFLGSYINIPVAQLPPERLYTD
ncbi:MAG TPA: hypothetical protein VFK23_11425, partial [Nitrospirota bacterium]|nr:hypothetical protein [Nitrospirota bacterium]